LPCIYYGIAGGIENVSSEGSRETARVIVGALALLMIPGMVAAGQHGESVGIGTS
jgi:hypothetical protein